MRARTLSTRRFPAAPISALAISLLVAGCASSSDVARGELGPEQTVVQLEGGRFVLEANPSADVRWERIQARPSQVYTALESAYADLGIPPTTTDRRRMIYGNTSFRATGDIAGVRMSRLFSCGRAGGLGQELADAGALQISIVSQLRRDGEEGARLRTDVAAEVRAGDITSVRRSGCASTGLLEALVAALAEHHLDEGRNRTAGRVVGTRHR